MASRVVSSVSRKVRMPSFSPQVCQTCIIECLDSSRQRCRGSSQQSDLIESPEVMKFVLRTREGQSSRKNLVHILAILAYISVTDYQLSSRRPENLEVPNIFILSRPKYLFRNTTAVLPLLHLLCVEISDRDSRQELQSMCTKFFLELVHSLVLRQTSNNLRRFISLTAGLILCIADDWSQDIR